MISIRIEELFQMLFYSRTEVQVCFFLPYRKQSHMKPFSKIAAALFLLVALMHLLRVLNHVHIIIDDYSVPMWISVLGFIIPTLLAIAVWRESKRNE
jgi:succinate dehydrogenase hydrophobic anchor subunit